MKKIFTVITILFTSLSLFAQAGSVELKDGGGVLISSHNTIQAAYNAIPSTITSPYIIEILATYNNSEEVFPVLFGAKTGSSITNTITIRPAAANSGEIITASVSGTGGVAMFTFDGCQYVILDGRPGGTGTTPNLKIDNTSTAGTAYTIELTNAASHNTIQYLFTNNATAGTAGGRNMVLDATPAGANSNNLIAHCVLDGGRSGIGLIFTSSSSIPNDSNTILDCVIKNFGYAGIWFLSASANTTVTGCTFYQETSSSSTIMSAISIAAAASGGITTIEKCKIYNIFSTATSPNPKGITGGAAAGATLRIINNFISLALDNNSAPTVYGIHLTGSTDYNVDILYNTIYIGGTHTGGTSGNVLSAGIVKANTSDTSRYAQKNNIVINKRTGGTSGGVHTGSFIGTAALVGTLDVDYNNYYASGDPGSYHAGWNSIVYNDLAQYKTAAAPNEQNTKFHDVAFISATDLHLASSSQGDIELIGTPIAGITDDIDYEPREPFVPYKGADEGTPLPVELTSFTASSNGIDVILNWTTATETNNSGFSIERKSGNTAFSEIGFVSGFGTTTESKSYTFADPKVSSGKYIYRLKQIDFNGTYEYSPEVEVEVTVPLKFSLEQNYPNPFNPSTAIHFQIDRRSQVNLTVQDILGRNISTLVNEVKEPGKYEVMFNGSNMASGVYIYKLQSNDRVLTKKFILMK